MAVVVTRHAQQRFLERYCGMSEEAIRAFPTRLGWARERVLAYWESFRFGPGLAPDSEIPSWLRPRSGQVVYGGDAHLFLVAMDDRDATVITYWSPVAEAAGATANSSAEASAAFIMSGRFVCPLVLRMAGVEVCRRVARDHVGEEVRRYAGDLVASWKTRDVDDLMRRCPPSCVAMAAPCQSLEPRRRR